MKTNCRYRQLYQIVYGDEVFTNLVPQVLPQMFVDAKLDGFIITPNIPRWYVGLQYSILLVETVDIVANQQRSQFTHFSRNAGKKDINKTAQPRSSYSKHGSIQQYVSKPSIGLPSSVDVTLNMSHRKKVKSKPSSKVAKPNVV